MVCQFWHAIFCLPGMKLRPYKTCQTIWCGMVEATRLLNIKKYHPQKQILRFSLFAFHFYFVPLHSL
jgi:hypothetical protein